MTTEMDTPKSELKIIPLKTISEPVLSHYTYKVAWWLNADEFTADEEKFILQCYRRGYHPRRTGQELQYLPTTSPQPSPKQQ